MGGSTRRSPGSRSEATELDRAPCFPREAFFELADAGALAVTIGAVREGRSVRDEWDLLRRVAAADASVGADPRRPPERDRAARSRRRAGAARARTCRRRRGRASARGLGSRPRTRRGRPGATRRDRRRPRPARRQDLLLGRRRRRRGDGDGRQRRRASAPALVLLDCGAEVEVDRGWYRAAGLRASESHRVVFHDAPGHRRPRRARRARPRPVVLPRRDAHRRDLGRDGRRRRRRRPRRARRAAAPTSRSPSSAAGRIERRAGHGRRLARRAAASPTPRLAADPAVAGRPG